MSHAASERYLAQYQAIAAQLPGRGLDWLRQLREQALGQFAEVGFPSPREEEWKYTNVTPIERKLFSPSTGEQGTVDARALAPYRLEDALQLVFVDGHFSPALSSLERLPQGIVVTSLAEAFVQDPERLKENLGRTAAKEGHGFVFFNTAFFTDGAFIYLPAGGLLEKPVQLIHICTRETLATTRHLIVAEKGAEGRLIETYVGPKGQNYLTAAVTELCLEENARLELCKVQAESDKAFHFGGIYAHQAKSAVFKQQNFSFGGLLVRSEIHSDLAQAAECHLDGLYLGMGRQHVDNHTRIRHSQPCGFSREFYKGILDQRAHGVFQGRIIVDEGAQKTDADMHNRNLLLSADAEIDTKPQLEIYADDVKCAHGVTVGQLDEASVFYLQARGVDEGAARQMLTFAFANEMVEKIKLSSLHRLVQDQLLKQFVQADIRKEWL